MTGVGTIAAETVTIAAGTVVIAAGIVVIAAETGVIAVDGPLSEMKWLCKAWLVKWLNAF